VLFRRPPSETRPALGELIKSEPRMPIFYSLRALEDEQQLDFSAAERIGRCMRKMHHPKLRSLL